MRKAVGYFDWPEPSLDEPEAAPRRCGKCGAGFDLGESLYWDGEARFCEECFKEWAMELLDTSPVILAQRMGFDVEAADG